MSVPPFAPPVSSSKTTTDPSRPSAEADPLVLAFTADEAFAMPLAVALYSALVNCSAPGPISVYVLTEGLRAGARRRLRRIVDRSGRDVQLHVVAVDAAALQDEGTLRMRSEYSIATFYRLLIGNLIPERHRRVLYLDCDVVVEGDLKELWEIEMDGAVLLAAPERTVSCPQYGVARWRELGLSPDALYFNNGVAVMDLERWREDRFGQRVLDYLFRHGDGLNIAGNQEGYNAVLAGHWKAIDPIWNVLNWYFDPSWFEKASYGPAPALSDLPRLTTQPKVIHYTTAQKPWAAHCEHPLRHRYVHYLRRSGYLTPFEFAAWRARLNVSRAVHRLKEWSRPYRHRFGFTKNTLRRLDSSLSGRSSRPRP